MTRTASACLLCLILAAGGLYAQVPATRPASAARPTPSPTQPQLVMPLGQTEMIGSAVFSPDGKRMIVAGLGDVKLWETTSGIQLTTIKYPDLTFVPPSFSPDGKTLLIPHTQIADLWDAATGRLLYQIRDSLKMIASASFSSDSRLILIAWEDGKLSVYQTVTGRLLRAWQVEKSVPAEDALIFTSQVMHEAFFSPDGKKIFVSAAGIPRILDATTGHEWVRLASVARDKPLFANFEFTPDSKKMIGYSGYDTSGKVWNVADGRLLFSFGNRQGPIRSLRQSPDGTRLMTLSDSGDLRILSMADGHQIVPLFDGLPSIGIRQDSSRMLTADYSPDGRNIITANDDGTVTLHDALTGTITRTMTPSDAMTSSDESVYTAVFNPAQQLLATISSDETIRIWDIRNRKPLSELKGHAPRLGLARYSPDQSTIYSFTDKGMYRWDPATGRLIGKDSIVGLMGGRCWDSAGQRLVTILSPAIATIWSLRTGQALTILKGHTALLYSAAFSRDGTKVVTASADSTARIWDAQSGQCLFILRGHTGSVNSAAWSPDGTLVATVGDDSSVRVWSAATGKSLLDLRGHSYKVQAVEFSPDGSMILSSSFDGTAKLWDAKAGRLLQDFGANHHSVNGAWFSPDGSIILLSTENGAAVWHVADQRLQLLDLQRSTSLPGLNIPTADFSRDGKKFLLADWDTLYIYDAVSGRRLVTTPSPTGMAESIKFAPDTRTLLVSAMDNTFKLLDASTGRLLYSAFAVDSTDYLVYDQYSRFDGSEGARKLLYYTCGTEVISLDQVKDQLWVPNLAFRILAGDSINAAKLSDLPICGLVPVVETRPADGAAWHFVIHPRSGGLGAVVVSVNGNETRRYTPGQLAHTPNGYTLTIPKKELAQWLVPGQDNPIVVKAYTAEGQLTSRGAEVLSVIDSVHHPAPNLFAVMVGISDYKGDALDLRYAAKDADDLSRAIGTAARSWLNQDGRQHVFMYNLTTSKDHYLLPEKAAIHQTFDSIAKKAKASDILLIFFAGHGVMAGEAKKHFYFLTADASPETTSGSALASVGISTQELADWIHPSNIRAQKRILILDACNSGQVINDLVTMGSKNHSYTIARNDDNAEQIRSIDKLNERSGLFILAASASNQSAFELSRYSHGLLTYALLKAMREDPAILDAAKYLNVSPWFDHAERTVTDLVRDNGGRQEPQLVSTTSFDIGIVDSGVIAAIGLKDDKTPAFSTGSFLNKDENVGGDDLQLTTAVGQQLRSLAARGSTGSDPNGNTEIDYTPSEMPGAWSLHGFYTVTGNQVTINVNIWRDNQNLNRFHVTGTTMDIKTLAADIIRQALDWIKTHS